MKRTLYIFLALIMLFSCLSPVTAIAADELTEFYITSAGVLQEYNGAGGDVIIPDNVVTIGMDAFAENTTITSVYIPSSVKEIGGMAFRGCTNLQSVIFENGCQIIGDCAFAGCTSLTSFEMPDSVISVETGLFERCTSLKHVRLSNNLTELPHTMFNKCKSLEHIVVPKNVTSIDEMTFLDCTSLKSITLPSHFDGKFLSFESELPSGTEIFFSDEGLDYIPPVDDDFEDTDTDTDTETTPTPTPRPNPRPNPNDPVVKPGAQTQPESDDNKYGQGEFKKNNTYTETTYSDVLSTHWFYNSVANAYEYGLMFGKSGTTFNPEDTMTVAEAITIACRLHTTYHGRSDVNMSTGSVWYKTYVDYALKNKIIKDGDFANYNFAITRAEMARIFAKTLPSDWLDKINSINAIPDMDESDADYNAVLTLYQAGICSGSDAQHNYKAETNIKRSEVAAIITRLADKTLRVKF